MMAVPFGVSVFLVTLAIGLASTLIETMSVITIVVSALAYGLVSGLFIWMMEVERDV